MGEELRGRRASRAALPLALIGLALAIGIGVVAWRGEGWLNQAIMSEDVTTARLLLGFNSRWARAHYPGAPTRLDYAIISGNADMVELFLKHGADPNEGHGAINDAAAYADHRVVGLLLDAGADPNARLSRGGVGDAPLHHAAHRGDRQMAEMLLAAGADPLATNNQGATPRDLAKDSAIIDLLKAAEEKAANP